MIESLAQEILAKLTAARLIVLVLHRGPDADSLGSAAALATFLETRGIPYQFYCESTLPAVAQFFGIDQENCLNPVQLARVHPEVLCTFDAGDLTHAGLHSFVTSATFAMFATPSFIVNFDHHATNTRFGQLNVVDTACASTTEVIYRFFQALRWPPPARTASYLLAGLLTDTDHFFNPGTTAPALTMAGELMARGVALSALRELLFEQRALGTLRLIGEILSRLKRNERYGLAVTYVTEADLAKCGAHHDDIEDVANLLNAVGDCKAMVVIKELEGRLRVSLRTTRPDIDLSKFAETLGGGGHRKAAGFRVPGALQIEGGRVKVR